jgi:hypothetical protein
MDVSDASPSRITPHLITPTLNRDIVGHSPTPTRYAANHMTTTKVKSDVIEEKDEEPDELGEVIDHLNEVMAVIDKNLIDLSVLTTVQDLQKEI